ncbi:MAG TPA: DUF2975 domain-containing protein [Steroidobacteraceae bacterium]|nr:DUF2975 domain-containing protein [Steroidobacteraceae bacterium]
MLVVLNVLYAVAIAVLLVAMPTEQWIMTSLKLSPSPEADRVIAGLHAVAVIGLVAAPLNHAILKRLLSMVETVRAGDPFTVTNAQRLQVIAWVLLALQLLGLVVGGIAEVISTPEHPIDLDAGPAVGGWLAVLLTFLLARVFAHGAAMRDDLEGTV